MSDQDPAPITIYTQTLLDILIAAAAQGKEQELRHAIREIRAKGIRKADVMKYAQDHLQPEQVAQLRTVIAAIGKGSRKAG